MKLYSVIKGKWVKAETGPYFIKGQDYYVLCIGDYVAKLRGGGDFGNWYYDLYFKDEKISQGSSGGPLKRAQKWVERDIRNNYYDPPERTK